MLIYYAGTGDGVNSYLTQEEMKKTGVNVLMTFFNASKGKVEKKFKLLYEARKNKIKTKGKIKSRRKEKENENK